MFHLDGERGFRGGERQLLYLAAALRERGHRNVVVCREDGSLSREASSRGFETRHLPFYLEWDPVTALGLGRLARAVENPVIHSHTGHTAALAVTASAPFVAHRRVDFGLKGGLSRLKYGSAGAVVGVSEAIRRILVDAGVSAEKIEVVPDAIPADGEESRWAGVCEDHFAPPSAALKERLRRELAKEFGIPPAGGAFAGSAERPWIGNLAALVPHKDHDTLISAAWIVLQKRPEALFLIAGEGPEEARLAAQIRRMGLDGRVCLVGQRSDPMTLMKALDAFVLSSWGEGMGSVLLEASACGLPIAATTAGGIPEIVEDGKSGLLVAPRDPERLAAAILRLIEDGALAGRLGEAARAALPRFGLRRMAERMEAIYDRVYAENACSR